MKRSLIALASVVVCVLSAPTPVRADAVYYKLPGEHGIHSASGTILDETGSVVEFVTDDGRTLSLAKVNVFQIVRGEPAAVRESEVGEITASSRPSNYRFGFKGGMNISNMSVEPAELEDQNSLQSYALGAWWGIPLNRSFTLQPEAFYSVKGDAESSGGYTSSTHMGYLDVPVLMKMGFLHGSAAQPSLFLGPSLAVNLSANAKLEGEGTSIDMDVKDQVADFELDLVVGGGVDFRVGERTVGLDLRYSKGLSNAAADGANGSGRNDVIAILGSIGLN